jgi:hypothetical protein
MMGEESSVAEQLFLSVGSERADLVCNKKIICFFYSKVKKVSFVERKILKSFLKSNKFETMQFVKPVCEKLRNVYFMTSVFYHKNLEFALSQTQVNLFSNKNE